MQRSNIKMTLGRILITTKQQGKRVVAVRQRFPPATPIIKTTSSRTITRTNQLNIRTIITIILTNRINISTKRWCTVFASSNSIILETTMRNRLRTCRLWAMMKCSYFRLMQCRNCSSRRLNPFLEKTQFFKKWLKVHNGEIKS